MPMTTFAKVAGFIGIGMELISMISTALLMPRMNMELEVTVDVKQNKSLQVLWFIMVMVSVVHGVFSIIGFVNYSSASSDCKKSPLGDVVLAWSILTFLGAGCKSNTGTIVQKK